MVAILKDLWSYRELLIALTFREIKVRYKQTFFGAAWAILQPVALTLIFTFVFGGFLKIGSEGIPYPVFAFSALLPWTFFTTAVSSGALSVVSNGNLVTKVYFPREILPIASVLASFFDFIMAAVVFVVLLLFYQVNISPFVAYALLIVPVILTFTLGVTLFLSCLNVMFRDVRFIVPLMLQIWLYVTPVIYSINQIPENFRLLVLLNPMSPLIQGFRESTVIGREPDFKYLSVSIIITLVFFIFSYIFFKSKERVFADII